MAYRSSGFVDGHCHPLFALREAAGPKLDSCTDVSQALRVLTEYLLENPATTWIDAGSLDRSLPGMPLTREQLDQVSATTPLVIHASDHHAIWVNTAALSAAGFAEKAPQLTHAHFETNAHGRPTGMIHEWDAMSLIYEHQPKPTLGDDLDALNRAQTELLKHGVVAVQEAWIDPGMPEVYLAAAERDLLGIYVNLAPRMGVANWRQDLRFAKETRSAVRQQGNPLLSCNTVKIFIDGVLGSQTALLKEHYSGPETSEPNHGSKLWLDQDLQALALEADSAGFQLHFHAIGDAAVSQALDAIQYIDDCNGFVDRRPVIAHAELVDSADLERAKRLGVVFCQQPVWAKPGVERAALEPVLGSKRTAQMYPIRTMLEAGVPVSFGSDWPVSEPNPLLGLYQAVTRTDSPDQAIQNSQAVDCYSKVGWYQLGFEGVPNETWVELDTDLNQCTANDLLNAKVLTVSVNGKRTTF